MKKIVYIFTFFTHLFPLIGYGVDLQPNDIVAPQPGKYNVMMSYYATQNANFYKNGSVVSTTPFGNPVIDIPSAILRVGHSYTLGQMPATSFIQISYGSVNPNGSLSSNPSSDGMGDSVLATALWPYANQETRTYLGLAAYLSIPTGSYSSSQAFNAGSNRYSFDLQIGFQKPITDNIDGMIAVDTQWFGDNSQCAAACGSNSSILLTQKPLTTLQLGPIYKINQTFTLGASYFYVAGGATEINNVYQNNVINTQRFLLSGIAYTDFGRFSLQYGKDLAVENGFIQTRVFALRYTRQF